MGISQLLLNHEADVNVANFDGALPLHYLMKNKPKGDHKEAYVELLKVRAQCCFLLLYVVAVLSLELSLVNSSYADNVQGDCLSLLA